MSTNDSLAKSIIRQCQAEAKAIHYNYSGGFLIRGKRIPFIDIYYIDYHRDFVNNYTDVVQIKAILGTREYYQDVLSNLDELEVYIHRKQMAESSPMFIQGGRADSKTYKAIIPNPPTRGLGNNTGNERTIIENPDQSATTIEIQLIEKDALDIKMVKWAGMLQETKPHEALAMMLSGGLEDYGIDTIQMVDPDVAVPRSIIIPQGTLIKNAAKYIQENYGLYNFGIGNYKFEKTWFVYPLYNSRRYDIEFYKMSVSIVDKQHVQVEVPRTYVVNNGNLIWYCASDLKVEQNNSITQLNHGTAFSVNNPQDNRGPNLESIGVNKFNVDGSKGLNTQSLLQRKDGLQNDIRVPQNTQNLAKYASAIYANNGYYVELQWRYANHELLYPGLPVKIMYIDNGLKTVYGTLHEYHATVNRITQQAIDAPYECHVTMRVYVTER